MSNNNKSIKNYFKSLNKKQKITTAIVLISVAIVAIALAFITSALILK